MTKQAHITSRPGAELGERVLGLCGKDFKLKTKWDEIPLDKPICRECVDMAIGALTEADDAIEFARRRARALSLSVDVLREFLDGDFILDKIHENDMEHLSAQVDKALTQSQQERTKQTCTCTWTTPEIFTEDPECPIHGGHSDAIPVEIEETEEK